MNTHTDQTEQRERIKNKVLAQYEGVKDTCAQRAVQEWLKDRMNPNATEPLGDLEYVVTAAEMEDLAVAWHRADIDENIAVERYNLAKVKKNTARSQFISGLAEHEGFCADSDDFVTDISRMQIWKVNQDHLKRILPKKTIAFCQAVINGALDIPTVQDGCLPKELKEMRIQGEFIRDFLGYLHDNGQEGVEYIKKICSDCTFAKQIIEDSNQPLPVRHLAQQVVTVTTSQASLKQPSIGFVPTRHV